MFQTKKTVTSDISSSYFPECLTSLLGPMFAKDSLTLVANVNNATL